MLFLMIMLFLFICFFFLMLNLIISKKSFLDREKNSSFECGFIPLSESRLPFSIHFYLIGILFLIFDVEIVFLFPLIKLMNYLSLFEWIYLSLMILLILYLGLEFEKMEGSLKWIF
uniref:NADH-ubiquinone oxidoreductase chain 3 n=1 Tax=Phaenocarpa sp. QL-2014 TaxID=1491723 RepID=A0A0U1WEN5_9HYME|nr:NADH dehydrogenase subunit 3 [Phaenocarpa sp. QL-2014]